jgi:DNA-binding SARP family transcriptional activator
MRFDILGPATVTTSDGEVVLAAAKPRALLVRLLIEPNHVVPAEQLVEDLWDGAPPRSANQTLQTYVSQLRKVLGADRLLTLGSGYRIVVEPGELDTERFEQGVVAGRTALAKGDCAAAADGLRQALTEWRGMALGDVAGLSWATTEAARLEDLRLSAIESLLEAQLALGETTEVVARAEAEVAAHPLRERVWAHLITAYYREGRQADALGAYRRLKRLLADELGIDPSPELRELESAVLSQTVPLGERRWVDRRTLPTGVVSFVLTDVVGSTELWESAPDDMADALARHDLLIRSAVDTYDGVFLKSRGEGDSTFSVFQRATDAVSAARAALDSLAAEAWPPRTPIHVRTAIHTGEALERDGDYYGRAVNRVARLREVARADQIVLSQATAELVLDHLPDDCRLVDGGTQELRNLSRPETIYRLEVTTLPSTPEVVPDTMPLPRRLSSRPLFGFIGRAAELGELSKRVDEALAGERRVVLLSGEPGIGKTALAFEAARAAYEAGAQVLLGRCDEQVGAPYQPWIEALGHLLAYAPEAVLDDVGARRLADVGRLVPEIAERRPHLPPPTRAGAESDRYLFYGAVTALLEAAAVHAPTLVLLDDIHWADTGSLVLLRHVVGNIDTGRLILLATYRDSELSRDHPLTDTLAMLRRESGVDRISLRGVEDHDIVAFIESAAGHKMGESGIALARAVHRETNGNPFFATEILRHLAETGAVSRTDEGRWETEDRFDETGLPESIREVVGRRVSRLGDDVRNMLSAAAVIGREFDLNVLAASLDAGEDELLTLVERAEAAGLTSHIGSSRSAFAHALVQHVLIADLSAARLARTHRQVAEAIERLGLADERLAELAGHWAAASAPGDAGRAVEYARRAGDQARAGLAPAEAVRWYSLALEMLPLSDDATRCDLLLRIGRAQRDADDDAYSGTLIEAGMLAQRIGDGPRLVRAALSTGTGYSMLESANPDRLALIESALAVDGISDADRARLLGILAVELVFLGSKSRCAEASAQGVTTARRAGDTATLIQVLANWCFANWGPEALQERLEITAETVQLAREYGNPTLLFWALLFRLTACLENFEVDEAMQISEAMTELSERSGQPRQRRNNLMYRSVLLLLRGDLSAAERCLADLRNLTKTGTEMSQLLATEANVAWYRGDLRRLTDLGMDSLGRVQSAGISDPALGLGYGDAAAALAMVEAGEIDRAREALRRDTDLGLERISPLGPIANIVVYGEVAAATGELEIARSLYEALLPYAGRSAMDGVSCAGTVNHGLGVLATALDRLDDADEHFAAAEAENLKLGPFQRSRTYVAWARTLFARQQPHDHGRAIDLLKRAQDLAGRYGCAGVEREAAELLASAPPAD